MGSDERGGGEEERKRMRMGSKEKVEREMAGEEACMREGDRKRK